ncbi:biotin--protein ligase 2-like [Wolffia australiana]
MLWTHPALSPASSNPVHRLRSLRWQSRLHFPSLSSLANCCSSPSSDSPPRSSNLIENMGRGSENSRFLVWFGKDSSEKDLAKSLASKNTLKLNEDGSEIELNLSPFSSSATFKASSYMESLSTTVFGRLLFWSPSLPSTQDFISQNFLEIPLGSVCVADLQSKGRGRTKNVWESPAGCLMFSFTLEMEDGRVVPLLQYVVSLAVTEAIKEVCRGKGPSLDVKIKWPNDLYLHGLKVGGVLCTSTYKSKKFNVSAGVGLNLDNEKPTTSLNAARREISSVSQPLQREEILASFFNNFERLYERFMKEGFHVLEELYYKTWLHSGQRVVIEEDQGKTAVTVQGLTKSGYLLAADDADNLFELHPDGNSLDFFKGLVRRKLS